MALRKNPENIATAGSTGKMKNEPSARMKGMVLNLASLLITSSLFPVLFRQAKNQRKKQRNSYNRANQDSKWRSAKKPIYSVPYSNRHKKRSSNLCSQTQIFSVFFWQAHPYAWAPFSFVSSA